MGPGVDAVWVGPGSAPRSSLRARGPGLLLLLALTGYTVENAWKNDVFFSWSYFSGWLALPFSILAGKLHSGKRVGERTPSPQTLGRHPPPPGPPRSPARAPWGLPPAQGLPPAFRSPGIYFLLADMVVQSTDAISGFPVYL